MTGLRPYSRFDLRVWLLRTALAFATMVVLIASVAAEESASPRHTNRLSDSANPYLLLHADNPVDWYPWGPEAFEKAKRENKPIFLSIGYSTCYWCHVAERTLFSNPEIAKLMNEWFVNVKVDREERPDIDAIYLLATQLITGGAGGWPNNLFLTPDLAPFYAGGYFPPEDDELGRPGFPHVLRSIHEQWTQEPERARQRAQGVLEILRQQQTRARGDGNATVQPKEWLKQTRSALLQRFDSEHGGLGNAKQSTKFPRSPAVWLMLLDYAQTRNEQALQFVTRTLDAMAYGGIYDQLGGGFHRYTTERTWSIPHFEKMLYDNAQLLAIYARAYQLTRKPQYKRIALGVRQYLREQMMSADGGFYTAQDAAVAGEEGVSYVWSRTQIQALLGEAAPAFFAAYSLTQLPGDESLVDPDAAPSVLRVSSLNSSDVEERIRAADKSRSKLLEARQSRAQPSRDEKILVGLNGLAIEALASSARILGKPQDIDAARKAANRIWTLAWDGQNQRLSHQIFDGQARGEGFLDDYALFGRGLLSLYEATQKKLFLKRAQRIADALLDQFDSDRDGILNSAPDAQALILEPIEQGDESYPSGISASVDLLGRLANALRQREYAEAAARIAQRVGARPQQWPTLVAAVNASSAASLPTTRATTKPQILSASETAAHVRATASLRSSEQRDEIVVILEIERGFHVNANPASFDFLIPTALAIPGTTAVRMRYPPPSLLKSSFAPEPLHVYEGTVKLVAELDKGTFERGQAIKAVLHTQACTESVCLPPSQIPLVIRNNARAQ